MEDTNRTLPESLQDLSSPKDIIGLDASRLEELLRIAKNELRNVDALVLQKEKAQRKQTFLEKFRKGFQMNNSVPTEEKEWNAEFTAILKSKTSFSLSGLNKRFDAEIVPNVMAELAAASRNVENAIDASPAIRLIPQDYRNTSAISTMISYLENGRASSWAECLDKLDKGGIATTGSAVKCPKCGSTNLQVTTQTDTEGGVDVGKAACGMFLLGPLGLLCGNKKKVVHHTDFWVCGSCGNKFPREG
ncbi:MAG: hypothetical protein LBN02_05230 [Oscillospiraceae bacterium]|jgi:ribosomal protein S27AE|nr:hypothetical protein [Oscillospiraceae bacterium]